MDSAFTSGTPTGAASDGDISSEPGSGVDHALDGIPVSVADEISPLLLETAGQIADVYRCMLDGLTDRKAIVAAGAAANTGAAANIQSNIRAIKDGEIPTAASLARAAKSAGSSFLKQHRDHMSPDAVLHVEQVVAAAGAVAGDTAAQDVEAEKLLKKGDELDDALEQEGGVYVYTYPHYWWYPTVEGTDRTLLKVGMTTKDAGTRVKTQAKHTAVPEEPLLLRVYQSPTQDPATLEKRFHRLIRAADHVKDGPSGGKEWFETSVDFLDTIAEEFNLKILHAEEPE